MMFFTQGKWTTAGESRAACNVTIYRQQLNRLMSDMTVYTNFGASSAPYDAFLNCDEIF